MDGPGTNIWEVSTEDHMAADMDSNALVALVFIYTTQTSSEELLMPSRTHFRALQKQKQGQHTHVLMVATCDETIQFWVRPSLTWFECLHSV